MRDSHFLHLHEKYKISKKGVLHIGAHEGQEYQYYNKLGLPKVLFVEANPEVYARLCKNVSKFPEVCTHCCAISNKIETTEFHVTSMDQSSSILPLGLHKIDFPTIKETKKIQVCCTTIDALLLDLKQNADDYNFLNIDIQGAELMAFEGATNLLKNNIQLINTEVNYVEMYKGCALKNQIDEFLSQFGFICVETIDYSKNRWGDAVYVKK